MANKPGEANFFPNVPDFPSMGTFQPVYGKFDLTTYIQGASDYEIMAFLVGKYNACLEAYGNITKLSTDTITACKQLQDWINSWFDNLDVQEELNNKINSMVADGSFGTLLHQTFDTQINQQTASAVTQWLVANVTPTGSAVMVDKSLSIEGAAADAKVTGELKEDISQLWEKSNNVYNPEAATKGAYISSSGVYTEDSRFNLSDYIKIPFNGDNYMYINSSNVASVYEDYKGIMSYTTWDENKQFISMSSMATQRISGFNNSLNNAKYIRLNVGMNSNDLMVVITNTYDTEYDPVYAQFGYDFKENPKERINAIVEDKYKDITENGSEKPLQNLIYNGGLTRIFRTAGVVGDSLSSGCMEYKDSSGTALGYDRYEFSWIQQMKGICGFDKAENFSVGGLTSKNFWTTQNQKVKNLREDGANHKCQLYFIALGVNDIADVTMEVGTANDISNESSTTFYGYYSRIIKLIQSQQPKARIFLVGLPNHNSMTKWGARFRDFRDAIADMANHFNFVYYIDLYQYELPYDSEFQKMYFNGFHENALGYARTAWVISSYVDWYIRHNYEEFREVGFIGTDYHYYE